MRIPALALFLISIVSIPAEAQHAQDWGDWKSTPNYPFIQVRVRCDYDSPGVNGASAWSYQLRNIYTFAVHVTYREEEYVSSKGANSMTLAGLITLQPGEILKDHDAQLMGTCESLEGMHVMVTRVKRASDDTQLPPQTSSVSSSVLGKGGKIPGNSSPQATGEASASSATVVSNPQPEMGHWVCRYEGHRKNDHSYYLQVNGGVEIYGGFSKWTLNGTRFTLVIDGGNSGQSTFLGTLKDSRTLSGEWTHSGGGPIQDYSNYAATCTRENE